MKRKASIVAVLFAVITAVFLAACASKTENSATKIELGQKYLAELNYSEAIISFTEAIEIDSKSVSAYMGRAEAYAALEQYDNAKEDYTQVIAIDASNGEAYTGRGDIYVLEGDYTNAIFDYDEANSLGEDVSERIENTIDLGVAKEEKQGGIQAVLAWLEKIGRNMIDLYKDLTGQVDLMKSMRDDCIAENYEAVLAELADEERQSDFAELTNNGGKQCLLDENGGKMTALYKQSGGYMLYYGEQADGLRSGNGVWIGNSAISEGTWSKDKPNGTFEVTVPDSYTISGTTENGLWNGDAVYAGGRTELSLPHKNGKLQENDVIKSGDALYNKTYGLAGYGDIGGDVFALGKKMAEEALNKEVVETPKTEATVPVVSAAPLENDYTWSRTLDASDESVAGSIAMTGKCGVGSTSLHTTLRYEMKIILESDDPEEKAAAEIMEQTGIPLAMATVLALASGDFSLLGRLDMKGYTFDIELDNPISEVQVQDNYMYVYVPTGTKIASTWMTVVYSNGETKKIEAKANNGKNASETLPGFLTFETDSGKIGVVVQEK